MGEKGLQTRRRLLEATAELIKRKPLRELSVSDITKLAKTSASTFYVYFADVPEAVLGVIRGVSQSTPELLELLQEPWDAKSADAKARRFVASYFETWRANADLFRVRNLAADEGDPRFITARNLSVSPLLEALAVRIGRGQEDGRLTREIDARSTGAALVAMIERLASVPEATIAAPITKMTLIDAVAFFATQVLFPDQDGQEAADAAA